MSFSTAAHEPSILSLALATTFIFLVTVAIYRLTLHPLAGVPGPVLAATTGLHETYFQLWKDGGGRHWVEVDRLHRIYGPIVRISPWEVHIADPEWNDIFKLSSKANKPWWYYKSFGTFQSTATVELDSVHKIRRKAFQTWFSSENVARNIPNVQATVKKLHDRLLDFAGHAVNLNDAYRSLAIDVATNFAFDKSFNNLDDPLFSKDFNDGIRKYSNMGMMNRYMFAVPFNLLQLLPRSISRRITHPALASFMALLHDYTRYSMSRPLVAHEHAQDMVQSMLTSDLSPELKCFDVAFGDCRRVILAGTETTATVLTCITYHLLSKPDVMRNLTQELLQAQKEKKSLGYSELRALPYLTAVIQEGLRTSYSTTGRLARYSRVADLHYKQYSLPRGFHESS
ncbi:hypothetical protein S40288_10349 [Stachybotrys chartarum IBT 40288]|nr:hypothetical protein S40288_10349 [Stachybotrys chartarum IBT 40288]